MVGFSRKYRLANKQEFQFVFAKPYKITRKHLLILYRPNLEEHARLGIIIGKHHVKQAVDRNRLRRIVRESFRHHKDMLKGLDIIVLMRSECTPLGMKALRDDIDNLWHTLAPSSKSV
jgi:ribonuclease P protein component